MKIRYDATIDDLIEVHQRMTERSETARSWIVRGTIYSVMLSAAIFLIPSVVIAYFIPMLAIPIIVVGIILASLTAYTTWKEYDKSIRKRLRKYYKELLGGKETTPFEMEIDEKEIRIKQQETGIIYEWSNVEEIIDADTHIEFLLRNGGLIFVRKRAFNEIESQEQFQREARLYLDRSRTSSNWLRGDES